LSPIFTPKVAGTEASNTTDEHVLYIGPSLNIWELMYRFPLASDYHLMDVTPSRDTETAMKFLDDLAARIKFLGGPTTRVRLLQFGIRKGESIVYQVNWTSAKEGNQSRKIHLHVTEPDVAESARTVIQSLPEQALGGLYSTATELPELKVLEIYTEALKHRAPFIVGLEYKSRNGQEVLFPSRTSRGFIHRSQTLYEVQETVKLPVAFQKEDVAYPTLYFFQKVNLPTDGRLD
jgi:hypothetical protein